MDRKKDEQISVLFDAELSEFENRKLLSSVTDDGESLEQIARYQLIGDVIRSEGEANPVKPGFAAAISERLQSEPDMEAVKPRLPANWLKMASGFAIAASVAVVAVVMAPGFFSSGFDGGFSTSGGFAAVNTQSGGTRWETVEPETEQQLNRYLVNHGEYASEKGMNHVVPYATFVSYDVDR